MPAHILDYQTVSYPMEDPGMRTVARWHDENGKRRIIRTAEAIGVHDESLQAPYEPASLLSASDLRHFLLDSLVQSRTSRQFAFGGFCDGQDGAHQCRR